MKTFNFIIAGTMFLTFGLLQAQERDKEEAPKDATSYYRQRAIEDAKYEQQFKADSEAKADAFWEDQEQYEKELKKKDRKAYRVYMKGKRDAYAEHYYHCDHFCHHDDYYYRHASYYYHGYYYDYYPQRRTMHTSVRLQTPRIRLGI